MSLWSKRLSNSVYSIYAKSKVNLKTLEIISGEVIKGEVEILGGKIKQEIPYIKVFLKTEYEIYTKCSKRIKEFIIKEEDLIVNKTINEGEIIKIPFKIKSPEDMPLNSGEFGVWVESEICSLNSIVNHDRVYIKIKPILEIKNILNAFEKFGFIVRSIYNNSDLSLSRFNDKMPFYQQFQIIPKDDSIFIDRYYLNLVFYISSENIGIFIKKNSEKKFLKSEDRFEDDKFYELLFRRVELTEGREFDDLIHLF
ncbi:MAG: sporulation protein [Clostridium chrysemydis]|uniref:sporulation protein n=1 Tax=Clostridium chrysemydis TaxID=2665504 RepID=UPI003F38E5A4